METIRRADTPDDWEQATALLHDYVEWIRAAVGIDPLAEQPHLAGELAVLADHYDRADACLFVAYRGDLAVGTVAVRRHGDGSAEIKRMYVRPVARGHGLAARLLDDALSTAARMGSQVVWLESLRGAMDPAIALYRRFGFVEVDGPGRTIGIDGTVVMERRTDRLGRCA